MSRLTVMHVCVLTFWITAFTSGCDVLQTEENGLCCNLCPPGTYMDDFCTKDHQTICSPCEEGSFSHEHHVFDRCERCRTCQQGYTENCTVTTDAKCSCHPGFLCSNSICSLCVKNKCELWDTPKRKVNSTKGQMELYTYECEPLCPQHSYFDAGVCKVRTLCGALGLAELFPGNKTHNSVCEKPEAQKKDGDSTHMFLSFGCVSLTAALLVTLSYRCMKSLRKHQTKKQTYKTPMPAVAANTADFQLSKEESGHMLLIKDESKDSNSVC